MTVDQSVIDQIAEAKATFDSFAFPPEVRVRVMMDGLVKLLEQKGLIVGSEFWDACVSIAEGL